MTVVEREDDMVVLALGRRIEPHPPRHAEMKNERIVTVGGDQPELGAALDAGDGRPGQPLDEPVGKRPPQPSRCNATRASLRPPSILFIPLASVIQAYGLFDSPLALILVYPTLLIPFSTWLLMGYFKTIPFELEECALIDGASRWQILTRIVVPLAVPGLISAFIFSFTLCWNEFIYALTFLQSTQNKTVPVAIVNEFVDGDIYKWGSLMAGALVGSLPLVILYAFFVEHYVSAMTGAVKE